MIRVVLGVDALRDRVRLALPADVEVYDGPAEDRAWAARAVTIASAYEPDQNAITISRTTSGVSHAIEVAEVACSVYAGSGDTDPGVAAALRTSAGAILAAIDDALRRDRTLGGAVASARLTSADWVQGRDTAGTGVIVGFVVTLTRID